MSSTSQQQQPPAWFQQFSQSFVAGEAHAFIVHGDVNGYAHEGVTHRGLLTSALASRRTVVAIYTLGRGITFPTPTMRDAAMRLLGLASPVAPDANPPDRRPCRDQRAAR